jgi:hypothetical protein
MAFAVPPQGRAVSRPARAVGLLGFVRLHACGHHTANPDPRFLRAPPGTLPASPTPADRPAPSRATGRSGRAQAPRDARPGTSHSTMASPSAWRLGLRGSGIAHRDCVSPSSRSAWRWSRRPPRGPHGLEMTNPCNCRGCRRRRGRDSRRGFAASSYKRSTCASSPCRRASWSGCGRC